MAPETDTICAVATPPGAGGISVIRVSGPAAFAAVGKLVPFLTQPIVSHRAVFGRLRTSAGEEIDEVVVLPFVSPRSFTTEDVVEISCHGSPAICQWILQELVALGCRIANKGEFTLRAFLNGRLDLVQAEAVLSLIESESKASARQALAHLTGQLSRVVTSLQDRVEWALANIEAGIDFVEEGLPTLDARQMTEHLARVRADLSGLLDTYRNGRLLGEGLSIVLCGAPNVGKSSLLNVLAAEDRAIVSEIAGTTRDTVVASLNVNGVSVRITDTAGLRTTEDRIETLGIQRARVAIDAADIIFYVFDAQVGLDQNDLLEIQKLLQVPSRRLLCIGNKLDLVPGPDTHQKSRQARIVFKNALQNRCLDKMLDQVWFGSAEASSTSREQLLQLLEGLVPEFDSTGDAVLTKARHFASLNAALKALDVVLLGLQQEEAFELLALSLQECLASIHSVLGRRLEDDVLDRVFREFCIGK